jgi:hypothetical protein
MRTLMAFTLAVWFTPVIALAGPCGDAVTQFEQKVRVESKKPSAGPTARQTTGAQLGHQPTPQSIKEAEERAQTAFAAVLVRARAADASGDQAACQKALSEAKDMFDPM